MRALVAFLALSLLFFFGCSYILTKNDVSAPGVPTPTEETISHSGDTFYLRYFNFQHANSTTREVQLEILNLDGTRKIQVLLLPGESFRFKSCGINKTIRFSGFNDFAFDSVNLTITYSGASERFNLSRADESVLTISCEPALKTIHTFTDRREAPLVFVGEKSFVIADDIMTDSSCETLSSPVPVRELSHSDWYSKNYDQQYIRRYMFRPNTIFCYGGTKYILQEDEDSKQCYTYLEKRPADSIGCRNLEGMLSSIDSEQ